MLLAQKGAMPEALAFANRAVALAPKVAPYQDTLAYVQEKAGNYTEAIEHLRTATQLQPANTEWRVNLAQTYLRAGQADKARATLANADGTPMRFEQVPAELQERLTSLQQRLDLKQ
jgi:Flp pilus assembly protein TadD